MARGRRGRASGAAAAAVLCGAAALLGGAAADKSDGFSLQELEVEDTHKVECERPSKNGDRLSMHYTGTLENGKKFDSSRDRGQPFAFTLGAGMVIKGWDKGLMGMCIGDKRVLRIPYSMAYGRDGYAGVIPPSEDLTFDVELVGVTTGEGKEL